MVAPDIFIVNFVAGEMAMLTRASPSGRPLRIESSTRASGNVNVDITERAVAEFASMVVAACSAANAQAARLHNADGCPALCAFAAVVASAMQTNFCHKIATGIALILFLLCSYFLHRSTSGEKFEALVRRIVSNLTVSAAMGVLLQEGVSPAVFQNREQHETSTTLPIRPCGIDIGSIATAKWP